MEIILRLRLEDRGVRKLLQAFIMESLTEYEKDYTIKVKFERNKTLSQKSAGKLDAHFSFMLQKLALFSTKGSIGQTTFAMNLAIALSKLDHHVALLDADLYGPDLISLLVKDPQPFYTNKKIFLFERYGVCLLSLRKLMEEKPFISWRGSCVEDCLQQVLNEINSENLNIVLVNLPPGMGDTQIALLQDLSFDGAIIITGTEDPFSKDLDKMTRIIQEIKIPLIGVVEDTRYLEQDLNFIPWDQKHGGNKINYLGNLPLEIISRKTREDTITVFADNRDSIGSFSFNKIAGEISSHLFH